MGVWEGYWLGYAIYVVVCRILLHRMWAVSYERDGAWETVFLTAIMWPLAVPVMGYIAYREWRGDNIL